SSVTGVQTCALPISNVEDGSLSRRAGLPEDDVVQNPVPVQVALGPRHRRPELIDDDRVHGAIDGEAAVSVEDVDGDEVVANRARSEERRVGKESRGW